MKISYQSTKTGKKRTLEAPENTNSVCAIIATKSGQKIPKIYVLPNRARMRRFVRKNRLKNVKIDYQGSVRKAGNEESVTKGVKFYKN
ncbi:MAG: hypothetical protein GXO49_04090 [Chlorobi bacterium]|nr:hypothetical protein [Chlorobiota bacterium]